MRSMKKARFACCWLTGSISRWGTNPRSYCMPRNSGGSSTSLSGAHYLQRSRVYGVAKRRPDAQELAAKFTAELVKFRETAEYRSLLKLYDIEMPKM